MAPPDNAVEMLDQLDEFLARNNPESQRLSDVLAVYRGPDVGGLAVKNSTSVPLRRAAFPRCAAAYDAAKSLGTKPHTRRTGSKTPVGRLICGMSYQTKREFSAEAAQKVSPHFAEHANDAIVSLTAMERISGGPIIGGSADPSTPVSIVPQNGTIKVFLGEKEIEQGFASLTVEQFSDLIEKADDYLASHDAN